MNTVLITLGVSFGIAFVLGVLLGFFKKVFHVPVDPTVEKVREVLPSANCGACGYPGCDGFAAAVAAGEAPVTGCTAGGPATAEAVGKVLGVTADAVAKVAILACQGCKEHAKDRGFYTGVKSCKAAKISVNGTKLCQFGCIGFGDCCNVCHFNALEMGDDGLPHVNYANCTGCSMCAQVCPQSLFSMTPAAQKGTIALCSNRGELSPKLKQNCETACIKCKKCEKNCPDKCIVVTNGIPVVDYSLCTSCKKCIEGCPTKVLVLIEDKVAVNA